MKDNEGIYQTLQESDVEKDLGLHVDNRLSFHEHVNQAVSKANRTLGLLKRTFVCRDNMIIKKIYTTMVRPILEYGNAPRICQYAGDMDKLEKVQARATKLCAALRDLPYEDRLKALKLPSLYHRRERGDMIQTYKIMTGRDRVNQGKVLPLSNITNTRGHGFKLAKRHGRLNIRKFSFGHRVVNNWNDLPAWVFSAESVNDFKVKLDRHWIKRQYKVRPTHAESNFKRRLERESQANEPFS